MALLLERITQIRTGDTWRNVAAQLDRNKVVEYLSAEARIQQTSELRKDTAGSSVSLRRPSSTRSSQFPLSTAKTSSPPLPDRAP